MVLWQALGFDLDQAVRLGAVCVAVRDLPPETFDQALQRLERHEALRPIVDPTAYKASMHRVEHVRRIVRAVAELRAAVAAGIEADLEHPAAAEWGG
jgi:hypothetical protein